MLRRSEYVDGPDALGASTRNLSDIKSSSESDMMTILCSLAERMVMVNVDVDETDDWKEVDGLHPWAGAERSR